MVGIFGVFDRGEGEAARGAARARTTFTGSDEVELHFGTNTIGAGLTLEAGDALFEQLAIELEADTSDVATLLRDE